MKKRNVMALLGIVTVVTVGYTLTGCGCSRVENNVSVNEVTVSENVIVSENIADEEDEIGTTQEQESSVTWIEVGKLETNPELRKAFDEIFGVNGDTGAKDGWIYKTQNITLQDALENEDTILVIYGLTNEELGIVNEDRPKLAEASGEAYVDVDELTEDEQIAMVLNSYFNLLPDSEAGYSNPYETLTRAQAMAMLMRATTPVSDIKADDAFSEAVGEGDYNIYAQEVADYALLNVENSGLDSENYGLGMTKAEAVYMITQALYKDDYAIYVGTQSRFDDLEMADAVAGSTDREILDEMIATGKVDNRIYTAYCVAEAHNMFTDEMTESEWSENITKAEFINYLVRAMAEKNFAGCTQGYVTEAMAEEMAAKMDEEADKDPHNQSVTQQQQQQQTQQPTGNNQQTQQPTGNDEPSDPSIDQQYQDLIDQGIITVVDPSIPGDDFNDW